MAPPFLSQSYCKNIKSFAALNAHPKAGFIFLEQHLEQMLL
jgi:hypothetical protein